MVNRLNEIQTKKFKSTRNIRDVDTQNYIKSVYEQKFIAATTLEQCNNFKTYLGINKKILQAVTLKVIVMSIVLQNSYFIKENC